MFAKDISEDFSVKGPKICSFHCDFRVFLSKSSDKLRGTIAKFWQELRTPFYAPAGFYGSPKTPKRQYYVKFALLGPGADALGNFPPNWTENCIHQDAVFFFFLGNTQVTINIWQFLRILFGRHLVGVWIGGVWNGHFYRVRKIFFRGRIFQENPWNSAERAIFAKFQAPKFENSEPEKLQFHTPSHSIPPLDSLLKKEVWCIPKSLFSREKEGKYIYTKEPWRWLLGTPSRSIGV